MSESPTDTPARIPFWRNVKTIGIFFQLVFAAVMVALALVLVNNVVEALNRTNIPANFSFLPARAGVPIAETPIPYTPNDPYWRALLIGLLNTLRVAVIGVVLATILGVVVGVMRLSTNWVARQVATGYVELIRNTPLAVQIIFWFTAVLTVVPPLSSNPITLPGGMLVSNIGIAIPWLFPGYSFGQWLPWLIAAIVIGIGTWLLFRRRIAMSDRPARRAWPLALALFILIGGGSYLLIHSRTSMPENLALDFLVDRGRGSIFIDHDASGSMAGGEQPVPYAAVIMRIEEATLNATTSNVFESRRLNPSSFRFPFIRAGEVEDAQVSFAADEDAERFSVHFTAWPSRGIIYEDRNGNGEFDEGEDLNPETGRGFSGVSMVITVYNFERYVVADRDGQVRLPRFESASEAEAEAAPAAGGPSTGLFGLNLDATADTGAELDFTYELQHTGPLVWSTPVVSVSNYDGGIRFSTSYLAMLLALVFYTAAFMAEIVRGGVQAVARGQTEAAKALGLNASQTFSMIVFPQALRIILPPMISQYLNLTKNSSLAPLAAYGELFAISVIVANQTGASVPVTLMLIAAYVVISLIFALILNIVNARIALVER